MSTPTATSNANDERNASDDEGERVKVTERGGPPAEGRLALMRRRMEYAMGMLGRHATLARLRKNQRLPLTEAAYNGHHEVLQVAATVCWILAVVSDETHLVVWIVFCLCTIPTNVGFMR